MGVAAASVGATCVAGSTTGAVGVWSTTMTVSCGDASGSAAFDAGAATTAAGGVENVWSATLDATGAATAVAAATTPATMPAFVDIGPLSSTARRVIVGDDCASVDIVETELALFLLQRTAQRVPHAHPCEVPG